MFKNLEGFIGPSSGEGGKDTFLGACAEFCPVDQLLPEESLPENDRQQVDNALEYYRRQCSELFNEFKMIAGKCEAAYKSDVVGDHERIQGEIGQKVSIFGLKPECYLRF